MADPPRRDWEDPDEMIGVDAALERILSYFSPLPAVDVPLVDALGMVLAEDVVSGVNVPPFRNSAMDGYAVRSEDTRTAPVELCVVDVVPAGSVPRRPVGAGEAIRIMTGAPLPDGADAVVRFEETDEAQRTARADVTHIGVARAIERGENVREPGEDIRLGEVVLRARTRLRPAEIGVLASLNRAVVRVHRRPRVAILSTGDEVIDLGPELQPGQIRNSNSYTIAALVRQAGGEPAILGVARDTTADLRTALERAGDPDFFVTSGGVSLGDYDMVKDVLRVQGAIDIWQVRMKPGKPLAFGTIGSTPLLGLPGNPVAALVSFEQFGRPAILKLLGRGTYRMLEVPATLTERLTNAGRRRHYVRGLLARHADGYVVCSTGDQGAAVLMAAVRGNCFIVVPESSGIVEAGTTVTVQVPDPAVLADL
jgi:molybdopterin molybdotransferase